MIYKHFFIYFAYEQHDYQSEINNILTLKMQSLIIYYTYLYGIEISLSHNAISYMYACMQGATISLNYKRLNLTDEYIILYVCKMLV